LLAFAALALAGCASDPKPVLKWSKPGGTEQEFLAAHSRCVENSRKHTPDFYVAGSRYPGTDGAMGEFLGDIAADFGGSAPGIKQDRALFQSCMKDEGWSLDPKGFAAPAGEDVALGY